MSYYKIPQDVEAEDKLIGPFTFKQFLFLIGFFIAGFLMISIGAQSIIVGAFFLPFVLFFGLLGFYRPKDQPVENKILAYLNFYFRPHTRIWSRDGITEHVIIRVPKKERKYYADDRTPDQVRSQLKQLAQVVDTRGWSTKQAQIQVPGSQSFDSSDRIYNPIANAPLQDTDIHEQEDMFDENANPVAENFDRLSQESAERARKEALAHMRQPETVKPQVKASAQSPTTPASRVSQVKARTVQTPPVQSSQPQVKAREAPTPQQTQPQMQPPTQAVESPSVTLQPPSGATPHYKPFPQMHQKVIDPYASEEQPETAQAAEPEEQEVPDELRQMAQSDMSISAIERHSKEYQEHSREGEISIDH